ncbi:hypothetical protein ACHAPJ_012659 [Fusarium lateritium]
MKLLHLAGLFIGLCQAADIAQIWDIHPSCSDHLAALQSAYDDVTAMAAKAQTDLATIQNPRPRLTRNAAPQVLEWDRVARNIKTLFGFIPDQAGHSNGDNHLDQVVSLIGNMNDALQGTHNKPENGYTGLHGTPMIACGDDMWEHKSVNDIDPNDPTGTKSISDMAKERKLDVGGNTEAWVFNKRYHYNKNARSAEICRTGVYAVTMINLDLITFCPPSWSSDMANTVSAVAGKDNAQEGQTLDRYGYLSLSRVMMHEFTHWYGGVNANLGVNVPDQQAVGKNGDLIYADENGKATIQQTGKKNLVCKAHSVINALNGHTDSVNQTVSYGVHESHTPKILPIPILPIVAQTRLRSLLKRMLILESCRE